MTDPQSVIFSTLFRDLIDHNERQAVALERIADSLEPATRYSTPP